MSKTEKNLHETLDDRTGLVVYLTQNKFAGQLKQYGRVHYVSRRMRYVVLYVDRDEADTVKERLLKENFVKKVEESHKGTLPLEYDGVLADMQAEINRRKKEEMKHPTGLFEEGDGHQ